MDSIKTLCMVYEQQHTSEFVVQGFFDIVHDLQSGNYSWLATKDTNIFVKTERLEIGLWYWLDHQL